MPTEKFSFSQEAHQYYASSAEEELPMTFQVALVGLDGFIIASDRQANFARLRDNIRWDSTVQKIISNTDVICAYSGDDLGLNVATDLTSLQIPQNVAWGGKWEPIANLLREFSENAWRVHIPKKRDGTPDGSEKSRVIVGLLNSRHRLWTVDVGEHSTVRNHLDKCCAGDPNNAAVIFGSLFYSESSTGLLPVSNLMMLAAHSVCTAHMLNMQGVAGLDIFVGEGSPDKPWRGRMLSEAERSKLVEESESITSALRSLLKIRS